MPEYTYRCRSCGDEKQVIEPMITTNPVICLECGEVMRRKPQRVMVNWNGLRPSQGFIHPAIKSFVEDAPRRREEEG